MKKIAIYTIQSINYGNRLQNYATQTKLTDLGYSVYTLLTESSSEKAEEILCRHPKLNGLKPFFSIIGWILPYARILVKHDSFSNFLLFNRHIRFSKHYIGKNNYSNGIETKYDAFIAGSDQIWNTEFEFVTVNNFLPFPHPCKVALSASFGVEKIKWNEEIANCLLNFKAISVREISGAEIIKTITGRNAEILIDPTMLLATEEWQKIEKKPRRLDKNKEYILTYFLSPKCDEAKQHLENIRGNLNVYELLNDNDIVAGKAGPSEFLYLINHAKIILTDSFHACVFSFLFNKPFIVYDRNWSGAKMNSRIETFCETFKLKRKYVKSGLENDIWEHDYSKGYELLELERKKAIKFIKEFLS